MSYYKDDDKRELFPDSTQPTTAVLNAMTAATSDPMSVIINSLNDRGTVTRQAIDKICPGCGKYGHSVFHNGCDFCAQYLMASEFFKKYPNASTKILEKHKDHQRRRQENRNQVNKQNANKGSRNNTSN